MAISRGVCAVALAALIGTTAHSAVIGVSTLVREPAGVPFTSPDAALGAPWVGYTLGLQSTAGELIGGIDVAITGQLHQRWTFDEDTGEFAATGNSQNATNGDSHLRAVAGALFGAGPTENNPGTGSPLPSTASSLYGVGSSLSGAWGITNAATTANVAYIVVPKGSEVSTQIAVKVANPAGDIIASLSGSDFFATNVAPIVGDKSVDWFSQNPPVSNSDSLSLVDDGPAGVWTIDSFSPPNAVAASIDPTTGVFSWIGNGSPAGTYNAVLKYTDGLGASDTGTLAITWHIPEPSTFALFGLALVGFAGCRRK